MGIIVLIVWSLAWVAYFLTGGTFMGKNASGDRSLMHPLLQWVIGLGLPAIAFWFGGRLTHIEESLVRIEKRSITADIRIVDLLLNFPNLPAARREEITRFRADLEKELYAMT